MEVLIFDMDGVLLQPLGYHRALKETVRLAGVSKGIENILLTDEQISQFEALGISSEWHSSALCMALIVLQKQQGTIYNIDPSLPVKLNLEDLFEAIAAQPMEAPARFRSEYAIERMAADYGLPAVEVRNIVKRSESIQSSVTLNWFQELVLGSEAYKNIYQRQPKLQTESYLHLFDQRLISEPFAEHLLQWAGKKDCGAAIMTTRPSSGPQSFKGAPEAEIGATLVELEDLPLIGHGEISWLAKLSRRGVGELMKPSWAHALAAILSASGWTVEDSLAYAGQKPNEIRLEEIYHLHNCRITVFEDTPGGIVAVQEIANILNEIGLQIEVQKIGIGENALKKGALFAQGAVVYPDINMALSGQDNF